MRPNKVNGKKLTIYNETNLWYCNNNNKSLKAIGVCITIRIIPALLHRTTIASFISMNPIEFQLNSNGKVNQY